MAQDTIKSRISEIEWWTNEWSEFKRDFREFLANEIFLTHNNVDATPNRFDFLRDLKAEYNNIINDRIRDRILQSQDEMLRKYIEEYGSMIIIQPAKGNSLIRSSIASTAYTLLDQIGETLANTFEAIINNMLNWVSNRLWDMPVVRSYLLESNDYIHSKIKNDINTLIKRVVHPAISLFIEYPRFDRLKAIECYQKEIDLLDMYYVENVDGNIAFRREIRGLRSFLVRGDYHLPITAADPPVPANSTFDQAYTEIRSDLVEFLDYLKNSIFYASGLDAYFQTEIDGFVRKVLNNSHTWQVHSIQRRANQTTQP